MSEIENVLEICLRRIRCWRIPRHYSRADWLDEMRALGLEAACEAERQYDPTRGGPIEAFIYQRILSRALTRYRNEWAYSARFIPIAGDEIYSDRQMQPDITNSLVFEALSSLPDGDRFLLFKLFWEGHTEVEIATKLGISHQAVSKRKQAALKKLRAQLDRSVGSSSTERRAKTDRLH